MLEARRLSRVTVAALAIAVTFPGVLSSSTAGGVSPSRIPPRPPAAAPRTLPPVSAGVPYVAPWQSSFERYSTQLLVPNAPSTIVRSLTVPRGQWWRVVYMTFGATMSAVVANRYIWVFVRDSSSNEVFRVPMPFAAVASGSYFFTVGPGLTSYSLPLTGGVGGAVVGIPDMLWRETFTISTEITNSQLGDVFASGPSQWAIEVYTPVKDRPGVLVPTPTIT